MTTTERLIERANAVLSTPVTVVRSDGSKYDSCPSYAVASDGDFQVYLVPVQQRTKAMRDHYRVTYYFRVDGAWKRTNRASFMLAMEIGEASA